MTTEVQKWADAAQFRAAPVDKEKGIQVHLLWMTPDPLGAIAAACRMYEGYPTYSLQDITNDERQRYWEQVQKTHLKAPLEFVKFHFFIEGVDRAFTHQMVRQRTAVYAQESMRFAVKDNLADEVSLPPSVPAGSPQAELWNDALRKVESAYNALVEGGVPAEDARGLLPHATPTRLNYCTDLRGLLEHAGNRLCTQAQFHWRVVFFQIVQAIRSYGLRDDVTVRQATHRWQFELIAENFKPVCYQLGKCAFKAEFDRGCTIRDQVDSFEAGGVPSSEWEDKNEYPENYIDPAQWLMNPAAGRVKVGDAYGDQSKRSSR